MRVAPPSFALVIAIPVWMVACGGAPPATPEPAEPELASREVAKAEVPTLETPKVTEIEETKVEDTEAEGAKLVEQANDTEPTEAEAPALDIEYVPTPENVVDKMLEVAAITKDDVVYDLGCGDGRLVIAAAKKYGARGVGFDLDPERVAEARANVEKAKVGHLVTIERKNIFDVDLTPATVVTLYLLPELNVRLVPQLERLAPKSRIVSHDFDMKGYDPDDIWMIVARHHRPPPKRRKHYVYLWTTPLQRLEP